MGLLCPQDCVETLMAVSVCECLALERVARTVLYPHQPASHTGLSNASQRQTSNTPWDPGATMQLGATPPKTKLDGREAEGDGEAGGPGGRDKQTGGAAPLWPPGLC